MKWPSRRWGACDEKGCIWQTNAAKKIRKGASDRGAQVGGLLQAQVQCPRALRRCVWQSGQCRLLTHAQTDGAAMVLVTVLCVRRGGLYRVSAGNPVRLVVVHMCMIGVYARGCLPGQWLCGGPDTAQTQLGK